MTVMTPSAERAFRTRRTVVRNSYVPETGKRLLDSIRPESAMQPIIATPQHDTGGSPRPESPCSPSAYNAKIVREDEPNACTGL